MVSEAQLVQALEMLTGAGDADTPEMLRAEVVSIQKSSRSWTAGKGIQGVGIGQKITDGEQRNELVLKVYVDKKKPKGKVKHLVPRTLTVPGLCVDIPIDVEEIGIVTLEPNTLRVRPAIPGFSLGHARVSVGTFGCLVRKSDDDKTLYILSNTHVLANEGLASVGDAILQPGKHDGGKVLTDLLAELSEWVPFQYSDAGYPNFVDAAIAKVRSMQDVTSAIRLIGVPRGSSRVVRRNMKVQKTGRTTDYTIGVIKDIHYRTALTYRKPGGGTGRVGFRDQVLCTRFTAGGDSGSAILNMGKKVVGLHFAGSPSASIFHRIGHVLDALRIEIVTDTI